MVVWVQRRLSCPPGKGLLEAGDEHQEGCVETVLPPVTPRFMAPPLCPPGPERNWDQVACAERLPQAVRDTGWLTYGPR